MRADKFSAYNCRFLNIDIYKLKPNNNQVKWLHLISPHSITVFITAKRNAILQGINCVSSRASN